MYNPIPIKVTHSQDLAAAALEKSYTMTKDGVLDWVGFGFNVACSQTITITRDSIDGANYDFVIKSETLVAATSFFYQPARPIVLFTGDILKVEIDTGGAAIAYMTAMLKEGGTWLP